MKALQGTKTEANLMTAFAGESQARNKYTYYASKARKDGYVQIAEIFEETAANEKEHAKLWFKLLHGGEVPSTEVNLEDAANGEKKPDKRALTRSPVCLRAWERSKRRTKSATASCWPTCGRGWSSAGTATVSGNAATAATSLSAPARRRSARSAAIRKPISS